jgi:hypothetical protein
VLLDLREQLLNEHAIEVFAAEESVTVHRLGLKNVLLSDFGNRNVTRAATQRPFSRAGVFWSIPSASAHPVRLLME